MVGHHHMDNIICTTLGHVATDAVAGARVLARRHELVESSGVALAAHHRVVRGSLFTARNLVGIVTSGAAEFALALLKTRREPQPVGGAGDLEFVTRIGAAGAGGLVEVKHEIG